MTISGFISLVYAKNIQPDLTLLPLGTQVSLLAEPVTEKHSTLLNVQSQRLMPPASTQKIITALAALFELGPDFRFTTSLKTDANIVDGILKGNLVIQMSGDPTFSRQQLQDMTAELKRKGIQQINGNIIIDTSIFNSHDKAAGWSWNNLTYCYNTPPSAAIIDGNCFYAGLTPAAKVNRYATVSVSPLYPVDIISEVITTSTTSDDTYCELDIIANDNNHYRLVGCLKQGERKRYYNFSVLDGSDYVSRIFQSLLSQQKITFNGKVIETKYPNQAKYTLLASSQSAPLPELLTEMLKKSNNLIADTVFRTIGHHHFSSPGNWRNSSDAVRNILKDKANIDLKNSVMMDGSGLSRLNLVSADTMMEILQYIAKHDNELQMINMLPIAGVDGSLQYRNSVRHAPLKENIIAKTGYLDGTYNLAGYIKKGNGDYIAFVQLMASYNPLDTNIEKKEAVMQFEEKLYNEFFK